MLQIVKYRTFSNICPNMIFSRAGEPANFFPAPAPHFFFKRLRLLIFFPSGSGSGSRFFFKRLRLQGAKNTQLRPAPASDYWLSLPTTPSPKVLPPILKKGGRKKKNDNLLKIKQTNYQQCNEDPAPAKSPPPLVP